MIIKILNYLKFIFFYFALVTNSLAELIKKIEITGNNRITDETIIVFSNVKTNNEVNDDNLNDIIKNLYETNFFKNISLKIENETLYINVEEEPLIQNIIINGNPVGWIGTNKLFLIESNIDIFLKPTNINEEYYNV